MDKSNMNSEKNPFQNEIVEMTKENPSINPSNLQSTANRVEEAKKINYPEPVIRAGFYSGNNGPRFYKKSTRSVYEKLSVDFDYRISSPSIEDARKMVAEKLKKQENKESTEEQR